MYSASIVYHFYISNCSAHADNNCNKCELTARSIVGIAKYRHVVTLKRVGAFSLCFWIASSAFTLMMFKNFAILKMYGYSLISPSMLASVCCYWKIVFGLRHHQASIQNHVYQEQPNRELAQNMQHVYSVGIS